ncbi:HAD family acid phosphatase [Sulfitobacter geojensis]|uniref:Polynucleotide kinase n=1 Tax=Sulfitobacter geojensis TaxID=1342299 RepID=A0AAE2VZ29_9RHOB|nr:HAD family acid phosphatase [Sulfitobacter geojensis]KHA53206.1 Polynucleotide kinase [Sulfitobacter geojensis]MBM1689962.1 polynucleotide kinase [Sulfitobacter geojensis]MBM1694028.1 polynucleotide kinase [Sulfitobacter geojensis]MBM1706194.1 polynucleotide kinase [Sulfitobacter geojensis]MBM1710252.1 polynucleotide kinase [Sulfitobacter geojensis]
MSQTSPTLCVVFDVDGTLAEFDAERLGPLVHGVEKHWDAFHHAMADAPLIAPIGRLMRRLKDSGETILICSGRPSGWAAHTIAWLHKHDLPFDGIYLRAEDQDAASDPEVKRRALKEMKADGFKPWLVIDDRTSVVDAWRGEGLVCLQCAPGDF